MPQGREDGWDDPAQAVDTHTLLLSLAGLLDDELLGWCRELVAVGEGDYAVELITSAVQAERVRLAGGTHEQLFAAASRRGLLGKGETLPPPDPSPRMRHRFAAHPVSAGFPAPVGPRSPEYALAGVPARLLRNCALSLTWRCTPAGAAPGPLPHPVVVVEADDADGAEVLAYQVGEVLLRSGVFASVEVLAAGTELGDYHRAALAEAHRVDLSGDRALPDANGASRPDARPAGPGAPLAGRADAVDPRLRDGRRRPEPPHPGPLTSLQDNGGPAPLRPVDRVIAARSSGPRRPRPEHTDRADAGFDEIASGLTFDRSPTTDDARYGAEGGDGPVRNGVDGVDGPARNGVDGPARNGVDGAADPPAERRPPGGSATPERRPGPRPTPPPAPGTYSAGSERGRPPGGGSGKRPPRRPDDRPSEAPLSEVEQRLLRQLHEELAARDDESSAPGGPPIFRGPNGGRKPGPNPPDQPPAS